MRVLLTGATGFVGARVAEALASEGHVVRALVRLESAPGRLAGLGAQVVRGDLRDADAVRLAAVGCAAIVHAAAPAPRQRRTRAEHRAVSVEATRRLLEAADAEGVRRVVFVGTAGVAPSEGGGDLPAARQRDAYHAAKAEGERLLAEHVGRCGTPAVVARLTAVYGPGDRRWVRLFRDVLGGRPWCVGDGRLRYPLTYVDDAARGLLRCLTAEAQPGSVYVLAPAEVPTVREILEAIAAEGGVTLRPRWLPAAPLAAAAALARRSLGPFGREPGFVAGVDFFTRPRHADGARARAELGFVAEVPLREGVRRTLAAYREEGWL